MRPDGGMKALIIKKQWLDLILSGMKTWELRGSRIAGRVEPRRYPPHPADVAGGRLTFADGVAVP